MVGVELADPSQQSQTPSLICDVGMEWLCCALHVKRADVCALQALVATSSLPSSQSQ
jgi:hypothetical protein